MACSRWSMRQRDPDLQGGGCSTRGKWELADWMTWLSCAVAFDDFQPKYATGRCKYPGTPGYSVGAWVSVRCLVRAGPSADLRHEPQQRPALWDAADEDGGGNLVSAPVDATLIVGVAEVVVAVEDGGDNL